MSFDITNMATDRKAENEGVWHDYDGGLRLKIARLNNDHHQQYMLEKRRKVQQEQRLGAGVEISSDRLRELTIDSMAKHILVGWECMVEAGKTIPYNQTEAVRLLTKYPEFYRLVEDEAMAIENFRSKKEGDDLGNSPTSDGGTPVGDTPSSPSE